MPHQLVCRDGGQRPAQVAMAVSVFDLFKIGIGPSSSHTVGPMRAARLFVQRLARGGRMAQVARVRSTLYGSLGATGRGHASDRAVLLGLCGHAPDTVDVALIDPLIARIRGQHRLPLEGGPEIAFDWNADLPLIADESLPLHANGMRFEAFDAAGNLLDAQVYYSVGGGFIVSEEAAQDAQRQAQIAPDTEVLPLPFHSGAQLLVQAQGQGGSIAQVIRTNERHWRQDADIDAGLLVIWRTMQDCVARGCAALLLALHRGRDRGGGDRLSAHRRRHRHFVQGERVHLRRRGWLPGRGGRGLLHGCGRSVRRAGRHARAGGERRRDWHGASSRTDL